MEAASCVSTDQGTRFTLRVVTVRPDFACAWPGLHKTAQTARHMICFSTNGLGGPGRWSGSNYPNKARLFLAILLKARPDSPPAGPFSWTGRALAIRCGAVFARTFSGRDAVQGLAPGKLWIVRPPYGELAPASHGRRRGFSCHRFVGSIGFDCVAHEGPKMNLFWPPSPRTCDGSRNWSTGRRHMRFSASCSVRVA
jgi:hypothetical protein